MKLKNIGVYLTLVILTMVIPIYSQNIQELSVFEKLASQSLNRGIFSKDGLSQIENKLVAIDNNNQVASVVNEEGSMVHFIYTNRLGNPKNTMKSSGKTFMSIGASRSDEKEAHYTGVEYIKTIGKESYFKVTESKTLSFYIVGFSLINGKEKISWKD